MKSKKVLFICLHRPDRSPSQRFRFEQYINFLNSNGYDCKHEFLLNQKDDSLFYKPGKFLTKGFIALKSLLKLVGLSYFQKFDIVFVQREAFMLGTSFFEKRFSKKSKLIFDFDDSIWLSNISEANKNFNWIKNPEKTSKIISYSSMIFAGNQYLSDYAKQYNSNIKIIPTTIDTDECKRIEFKEKDSRICIGWSGSITTIQHFNFAIPFLRKIREKYGNKVIFKVIGDKNYFNEELEIQGLGWKKEDEIIELSKMDIGIMPLPNDEWARGKCGLKGLLYMSLEIPTIMSPVGVNSEIISDGKNGFLADGVDEWLEKLSILIENPELREKMGKAGRQTVIEKYSVESQKNNYLKYFDELIS